MTGAKWDDVRIIRNLADLEREAERLAGDAALFVQCCLAAHDPAAAAFWQRRRLQAEAIQFAAESQAAVGLRGRDDGVSKTRSEVWQG